MVQFNALMKLTKFTDFSFRVLIFLATHAERKSTIEELHQVFDIPIDHLRKIIHHMAKKGIIQTVRGQNGGINLEPSSLKMGVGDLLKKLEPDMALVECLGLNNTCFLDGACVLKKALAGAQRAFLDHLNEYDLSSLVHKKLLLQEKFAME